VVFVGSSSIRLWNDLEREFGSMTVVKRGFGGSRLSDCARYVAQLVLPYQPRTVVVYAGDNDLAEGATPQGVLASYTEFVERVREALPETRIVYISIKPSPSREALMPLAIQANELIEAYSSGRPGLGFIDVYTRMLDEKGRPRAELFLPDALHLNAAGYALWKAAIAEHLR
jgi:lysophospholipase L1-like esterase